MSSRRIWMYMIISTFVFAGCASQQQSPPVVVEPKSPIVVAPQKKTLVVVAPDKDGKVGTVAVTTSRGETLIDKPYAAVSADRNGSMETLPLTGEKVKILFQEALAVQPERPVAYTLFFLEGKDELTGEAKARLKEVLAEISRRGGNVSEVTVVGHTDRVGKVEYNDRLSLQRAQRITNELVRLGVSPGAISAAGRGEREPLIPTEDEVAEPRNRRVDITVR
jgi:outer membrane protein OmpA-like peptidoglycan-associated protein